MAGRNDRQDGRRRGGAGRGGDITTTSVSSGPGHRLGPHPVRRARRPSNRPGAPAPAGAGRRPGTPAREGRPPSSPARAGSGPFARRSTRRLAMLAGVFVLLAVMLVPTGRAYLKQQHDLDDLRAQIDARHASIAALQAERERWNDPAYVEQQARERLKFVRPGEKAYQVIGAEKLLGDRLTGRSTVVNPSAGDDSVPWYGRMWSSVVLADRMDGDSTEAPVSPIGGQDGLSDPTAPQNGATPAPSSTTGAGGVGSLP